MNNFRGVVVLLGPPASGKTTVADAASADPEIRTIAVGRLLKDEAAATPESTVQAFLDRGELVPLPLVELVIRKAVASSGQGHLLFDGFPRTEEQIHPFFLIAETFRLEFRGVTVLRLGVEEAIERITARRVCASCGSVYHLVVHPPRRPGTCDRCGGELIQRQDDRPEVVRFRYRAYERETSPVINYFRQKFPEKVFEQPANLPPVQLSRKVKSLLKSAPAQ